MQAWRNPYALSFAQCVADFQSRKQTPRDFLERCIANIDTYESRVKAFVALDLKMARKAADAASNAFATSSTYVKLAAKSPPVSRIVSPRNARIRNDGIGPRAGERLTTGGP